VGLHSDPGNLCRGTYTNTSDISDGVAISKHKSVKSDLGTGACPEVANVFVLRSIGGMRRRGDRITYGYAGRLASKYKHSHSHRDSDANTSQHLDRYYDSDLFV
jgi:hypothetical protein